jgi:chaperonin GroEL (HSP60 family)
MFEYDHTKLQERLAKLSSGVAVITVGGLIIRSRSW